MSARAPVFLWVMVIVAELGLASQNFLVQVLQCVILVGYPMWFLYFVGPILTAFVLSWSQLVAWGWVMLTSPQEGIAQAKAKYMSGSAGWNAFWANYVFEVRRDYNALVTWIATKSAIGAEALSKLQENSSLCEKDSADNLTEHTPLTAPLIPAEIV